MLSTQEIEKIKQGVATIREQLPDADLLAIIRMFNVVFGYKLGSQEKSDAETLIREEWMSWLS